MQEEEVDNQIDYFQMMTNVVDNMNDGYFFNGEKCHWRGPLYPYLRLIHSLSYGNEFLSILYKYPTIFKIICSIVPSTSGFRNIKRYIQAFIDEYKELKDGLNKRITWIENKISGYQRDYNRYQEFINKNNDNPNSVPLAVDYQRFSMIPSFIEALENNKQLLQSCGERYYLKLQYHFHLLRLVNAYEIYMMDYKLADYQVNCCYNKLNEYDEDATIEELIKWRESNIKDEDLKSTELSSLTRDNNEFNKYFGERENGNDCNTNSDVNN